MNKTNSSVALMTTARFMLAALIATTALPATVEAANPMITLENDLLKVSLDRTGIKKIHDKQIDRTVDLSRDQFSLAVNGHTIESGSIRPMVKQEQDTTVA
jgi:hypothetical protein